MERVISEFRIVETDDGYRLEVKGDKKAIHQAMCSFRHRQGAHGFPFPPFAFAGYGPWRHHGGWSECCCSEEGEEQGEEGKKGE